MGHPIRSILIANRGEISSRIQRTCRRLGIKTIAVYSEADADMPFVRTADVAVCIGGAAASESYLNQERILWAAQQTRPDALHPGYGFLAEDAGFARAVEETWMTFVGPPSSVIQRAGSKIEAKKLAADAGVPVVPGFAGLESGLADGALSKEQVAGLRYPVLIKAAHGGGGRGMRVVQGEGDLVQAVASAQREALAAFGDGTLLFETFLPSGRHVEVQVLGDGVGNLIHLYERDCSTQRRHQKLIEETPAPELDGLREPLLDAALRVARALEYQNAGTVEFVVDDADNFYFLEVNARLQVEHTVTELVTGLDLVEEQLRVASGEPLRLAQEDVQLQGHAIEARLCAEDPRRDHLPSAGELVRFELAGGDGMRVDAAFASGCRVSAHYDSLLAKVIAHAPTRGEAQAKLSAALQRSVIHGLPTNRAWLAKELLNNQPVWRSSGDTGAASSTDASGAQRDAAIAVALSEIDQLDSGQAFLEVPFGFRLDQRAGNASPHLVLLESLDAGSVATDSGEGPLRVEVEPEPGQRHRYRVVMGEGSYSAAWCSGESGYALDLDGVRRPVVIDRVATISGDQEAWVTMGDTFRFRVVPRFVSSEQATALAGCVAPMASTVRKVHCGPGDAVAKGAPLVVLEAMKMEHVVVAPTAAAVKAVRVEPGDQVAADQLLVELDETTGR